MLDNISGEVDCADIVTGRLGWPVIGGCAAPEAVDGASRHLPHC
jgi:hypothetical protein